MLLDGPSKEYSLEEGATDQSAVKASGSWTELLYLLIKLPPRPSAWPLSTHSHRGGSGRRAESSSDGEGGNQVPLGFGKSRLPAGLTRSRCCKDPSDRSPCTPVPAQRLHTHSHAQPWSRERAGQLYPAAHKHHLVDSHPGKARADLPTTLGTKDRLLADRPSPKRGSRLHPHQGEPGRAWGEEHLPRRRTRAARGGRAPRRCDSQTYRWREAEGEPGCCDSAPPVSPRTLTPTAAERSSVTAWGARPVTRAQRHSPAAPARKAPAGLPCSGSVTAGWPASRAGWKGSGTTDRSQGHTRRASPEQPSSPQKAASGLQARTRISNALTSSRAPGDPWGGGDPWEGGPRGSFASTGSHPSRLELHPGLGPVLPAATLPPQGSLPRGPSKRNKYTLRGECSRCPPQWHVHDSGYEPPRCLYGKGVETTVSRAFTKTLKEQ